MTKRNMEINKTAVINVDSGRNIYDKNDLLHCSVYLFSNSTSHLISEGPPGAISLLCSYTGNSLVGVRRLGVGGGGN